MLYKWIATSDSSIWITMDNPAFQNFQLEELNKMPQT